MFRQYSRFVFDYLHLIIQLFFSRSESGYSLQKLAGYRGMVNPVFILVYRVGMNGVMHVHILAWIFRPRLLQNSTKLIF